MKPFQILKNIEMSLKKSLKDESVKDVVCGWVAQDLRYLAEVILGAILTFGIGSLAAALKEFINQIVTLIRGVKSAIDGNLSPSDFNRYSQRILMNLDVLIGYYKSAQKDMNRKYSD